MTSAPCPSRLSAQDFAFAGLLLSVSQVLIWNWTVAFFCALIWATRIFAAASAGVSNGFMFPVESNAQPITTFFLAAGAALPPVVPTSAATAAAPATSATNALHLVARVNAPSSRSQSDGL